MYLCPTSPYLKLCLCSRYLQYMTFKIINITIILFVSRSSPKKYKLAQINIFFPKFNFYIVALSQKISQEQLYQVYDHRTRRSSFLYKNDTFIHSTTSLSIGT